MRRDCVTLAALLVAVCALALAAKADVPRQRKAEAPAGRGVRSARIREVRGGQAAAAVPRECLAFVREFLAYVSKEGSDLTKDSKAQEKWLTEGLRERLKYSVELCHKKQEQHPDDRVDCPENETFVGAWDYPTTYSVIGSRRYGDRAVVDLQYEWGEGTNYPGDRRLLSYILLREDGGWKLDDIYTFGGEFIEANSLREELEKLAGYIALSARIPSPYIDHQLSGPVTLNQQWLELTPKEPLKVERDTQEVALFPDPPIKMVDDPKGKDVIIPADGRDATIEAELIGSDGVTYRSRPGYSQHMTGDLYVTDHSVGFKDLPRDVTFLKVRVRSSAPYPVKRILWRCYTWSEANQ